jgi:hypothetical protein
LEVKLQGSWFRVQGIRDLGSKVYGFCLSHYDSWFREQDLGFRVLGFRFMAIALRLRILGGSLLEQAEKWVAARVTRVE